MEVRPLHPGAVEVPPLRHGAVAASLLRTDGRKRTIAVPWRFHRSTTVPRPPDGPAVARPNRSEDVPGRPLGAHSPLSKADRPVEPDAVGQMGQR